MNTRTQEWRNKAQSSILARYHDEDYYGAVNIKLRAEHYQEARDICLDRIKRGAPFGGVAFSMMVEDEQPSPCYDRRGSDPIFGGIPIYPTVTYKWEDILNHAEMRKAFKLDEPNN